MDIVDIETCRPPVVATLPSDADRCCRQPGISDAGAHLAIMQDATTPTTMLSHWAVGRTEGTGTLPIETCVKKQARDTVRQSASN